MNRTPGTAASAPRLSVLLLCVAVSYSLLLALVGPFALRRAEAKSRVGGTTTAAAVRQTPRHEGELLVRFRAGSSKRERDDAVGHRGGRRARRLRGGSDAEKVELPAGQTPEAAASDPRLSEQWALQNTGQGGGQQGSDVNSRGAWATTTGSTRTVVAVIDSGIDFTHPDLANNEWSNPRERTNGRNDDGDGFVGDLHGWGWVSNGNQIADQNGHGTAVA